MYKCNYSLNPTCQMWLWLFAGSLSDGAHDGDQVLLLLILVVMPLEQSLSHLHSHAVVQLVGRLLVVQNHVCSTRTRKDAHAWVVEIRLFFKINGIGQLLFVEYICVCATMTRNSIHLYSLSSMHTQKNKLVNKDSSYSNYRALLGLWLYFFFNCCH